MKHLFTMWKHPRMVAWFAITTLLLLGSRVLFMRAQIIPYVLEFQPAVFIVLAAAAFWGPAGVWAAVLASLAGDYLTGLWGAATIYRTIGWFLFALSVQRAWCYWEVRAHEWPEETPTRSYAVRLFAASIPGCFIYATWQGFGAESLKLYPYTYIATLSLVHNLIFCAVFSAVCCSFFVRRSNPRSGTWHDAMQTDFDDVSFSRRGVLLLLCGSLGAYLIGLFASGFYYGIWPNHATVIGLASGAAVVVLVGPFLLLQFAGVFSRR